VESLPLDGLRAVDRIQVPITLVESRVVPRQAVPAAIGLAAGSLGTETDGSIVCPASYNNVVGIKPTVGLTSRTGGMYSFWGGETLFDQVELQSFLSHHTEIVSVR
jgi:hypothetical protein